MLEARRRVDRIDYFPIINVLVKLFNELGMLDCEVVVRQLAYLTGQEQMVLAHSVMICISQVASTSHGIEVFIVLLGR